MNAVPRARGRILRNPCKHAHGDPQKPLRPHSPNSSLLPTPQNLHDRFCGLSVGWVVVGFTRDQSGRVPETPDSESRSFLFRSPPSNRDYEPTLIGATQFENLKLHHHHLRRCHVAASIGEPVMGMKTVSAHTKGTRARVAREAASSDLALQYGSPRQHSPTRSSELARAQELGGTISAEVNLLHNAKYTNDGGQETEPKESNVLQDEYVERHGAADNLNSDDGLENEDDIDNVYIDDTDDLDYTEGKKTHRARRSHSTGGSRNISTTGRGRGSRWVRPHELAILEGNYERYSVPDLSSSEKSKILGEVEHLIADASEQLKLPMHGNLHKVSAYSLSVGLTLIS